MHLVFELIASMNEEEADKNDQKPEKQNRNDENRRKIIGFIADKEIRPVRLKNAQSACHPIANSMLSHPPLHFSVDNCCGNNSECSTSIS